MTILPARWVLVGAEIPRLDEFSLVPGPHNQLGSFNIVLNAGSGLSGNKAALAAFSRAANHWISYFSDPININIDANLVSLGSGIIGATGLGRRLPVVHRAGERDDRGFLAHQTFIDFIPEDATGRTDCFGHGARPEEIHVETFLSPVSPF